MDEVACNRELVEDWGVTIDTQPYNLESRIL